ncbi:hypothetical protein C8Q80DRAFT_1066416, partial [Daedaleopsis nitida]
MWLKSYLDFGPSRPLWALVADDILARLTPKECAAKFADVRLNPFLQDWKPMASKLPPELKAIVQAAKTHGLRAEGLAFSRDILRQMPMWYHVHADRRRIRTLAATSRASACLRTNHRLRSVGDFVRTAEMRDSPCHWQSESCQCNVCDDLRQSAACENPDGCFARARLFLDTLPPKWDPRGAQPEDWEEADHAVACNGTAELGDGIALFDRRISTQGELGEVLRIFTSGDVCNEIPNTQTDERADGGRLTMATDGSCLENGQASARAGAGIYIENGHELNRAVKLPAHMAQSNQTGEIVAALIASTIA